MQGWIDRALGQVKGATAALTEALDHGIAVRGTIREDGEQEQVQVSFEGFTYHVSILYLVLLGVKRKKAGLFPQFDSLTIKAPESLQIFWGLRISLLQSKSNGLYSSIGATCRLDGTIIGRTVQD